MSEAVEIFSRVTSREVTYSQTPWEQFRETAPEEITLMYRWLNDVGYVVDTAALRREYPSLTTFERYLRDHGWENA